jgi:hypothetical protein
MLVAIVEPPDFRENVLGHGIHVSAEPLGIVDASCLESDPDPAKGFLAHILNGVRVHAARAQSDPQALTEVRNEVCFGCGITSPKAAKIFFIEGVEVHWCSFQPVYFSICGRLLFSGANGGAERSGTQ